MSAKSVVLFVVLLRGTNSAPHICDESELTAPAGNMGQSGDFPWLGIIRVHLHEGAKLRVAVTGAILVKAAYAITIADDIAKIPKRIFQADSRAMFFAYDNEPTLCTMKDYLLHPEYRNTRYNTIALIELEPKLEYVPVLPICLPSYLFNASNQLYYTGYTDDKGLLEKEIHRMQYIDQRLCNDFYYKAGFYDVRYTAKYYICGQAVHESYSCEWDNGMALASNASGRWVLLGLGIGGPGCGAPSRFIEIYQYLQWIESATTGAGRADLGKSAFGTGFQQLRANKKERMRIIPIHEFFRVRNESDRGDEGEIDNDLHWFSDMYDKHHYEEYYIDRLDKDAIVITKFRDQYEKNEGDCRKQYKSLVYTETMKIYSQTKGMASYKISLMDLMVDEYTCVIIRLESPKSSETYLWYNVSMYVDEPLGMFDRSPDFHIKHYPIEKEELETTTEAESWQPNKYMKPFFVSDDTESWKNHTNVNLYMKFRFDNEAYLKLQVWGRTPDRAVSTIAPRIFNFTRPTKSTKGTSPSTTTPKTRRFRFKSRDKNRSAHRNEDLQQHLGSSGIRPTRKPHLREVQSDNGFRVKSKGKDRSALRNEYLQLQTNHIRNKPWGSIGIRPTRKPNLREVQSDNGFRDKSKGKDRSAHRNEDLQLQTNHIRNKPWGSIGIRPTRKPYLREVQSDNGFRVKSRGKDKSEHRTIITDLQETQSEHVNNSPLRLRRIILTRRPYAEVPQDHKVEARVLPVVSRANHGCVHTDVLCFLALLNLMF